MITDASKCTRCHAPAPANTLLCNECSKLVDLNFTAHQITKPHTLEAALSDIERLRKALQIIHVWANNPRSDLAEELEDISRLTQQTLDYKDYG